MARFQPGESGNPDTQIHGGIAEEYQKRSVESRKVNRTLRETMLAALNEDGGGGMTRLEHLARKAMENHRKGKLTFKDMKDLASILGEDTMTVKHEGATYILQSQEQIEKMQNIGKLAE